MKGRIEIDKAENGYTIVVWEEKEDDMYCEPEKYVATSEEEVLALVKEHLPEV